MSPEQAKKTKLPFYATYKEQIIRVYDFDEMLYLRASAEINNKRHFMVDTDKIEKITKAEYPEYFL